MSNKSAILVGLKQVDPSAYGGWDGSAGCWGCELDVDNIALILEPLDYDVAILKTAQATRDAVLGALTQAAKKLKAGDTLVFYYSGHGGQQPDDDGDESDGQDETLVAYDGEIIDDQLNAIWITFRTGVRIIMISDSCNSGTNYRNIRDIRTATSIQPVTPDVSAKMRAQMIHMGGCRDGFSSAGYQSGGKFTMAMCETWNHGNFQGDYRSFHAAIANKVTGQSVEYNEYGRVTATFRGETPFTGSNNPAGAGAGPLGVPEEPGRRATSAGGQLIGPRFGAGRGLRDFRTAGGVISKQSGVDAVVQVALAGKFSPTVTVRYGDGTYYLPTLQEMEHLLSASQSERRSWTAERFDCDDFSYVLKGEAAAHSYDSEDFRFGLCVGIIWGDFDWVSGYHAVNWFIDSQRKLYLIEPQTDNIYPAQRCVGNVGLIVV